jgi:hypothetical protein
LTSQTAPIVWPGRPYPLGATWDGEGVNFAIFSETAEKVELCLFDQSGRLAFPFASKRIRFGTVTCQKLAPGCYMDIVCTVPTIPPKGLGSIRTNFYSTPTRSRYKAE